MVKKSSGVRAHHGMAWFFLLYSGAGEWHVRVMLYIKSVSPPIILDSEEELC